LLPFSPERRRRHGCGNGEGLDVSRRVGSLARPWLDHRRSRQPARTKHSEGEDGARLLGNSGAAVTLSASMAVGYVWSGACWPALELEERFRTAGKIAAGVTHDLAAPPHPSCARLESSSRR